MKKLYALILSLAIFSGCSQFDDIDIVVTPTDQNLGKGRLLSFSASNYLSDSAEDESRAGIEQITTGDGLDYASIWSNNDDLTVVRFDSSTSSPVLVNCSSFENSLSEDRKTILFNCETNSKDNVDDNFVYRYGAEQYAIYPQMSGAEPSDYSSGKVGSRIFKVNLPDQKLYGETEFHYPLLVGRWSETAQMFLFKNPLATIKLTLKAPAGKTYHLRSITITGRNMEHMWGKATVTANATGDSSAVFEDDDATYYASMNCLQTTESGAQEGYAVSDAGAVFYVSIPAQTYSRGLNISLICDEGVMDQTLKKSGLTVTANQLLVTPDLTMDIDESGIYTAMLRCTDSTIGVAWTTLAANAPYLNQIFPREGTHNYSSEKAKTYTIALYKDSACSNLLVSWLIVGNKFKNPDGDWKTLFNDVNYPQRFTFSGLTPNTTYYLKVTADGVTSRARAVTTLQKSFTGTVTTSNAKAGNTILYENFANLVMGADITSRSCAYSSYKRNTYTTVAASKATGATPTLTDASTGEYSEFYVCDSSTEMGLFNTLHNLISDAGLSNWSWYAESDASGQVIARAGYVKIGTSAHKSAIVTPALTALGSNVATITVKFRACPYGGATLDPAESEIAVRLLDGGTVSTASPYNLLSGHTIVHSHPITLEGNQTSWKDYEVTFTGASKTSRIAIGGNREESSVPNRFMVDDIQVIVKSIDGVTASLVRATDTTIAVGWTITPANTPYLSIVNTQKIPTSGVSFANDITKTWEVGIYSDEACTKAVQVLKNLSVDQKSEALYSDLAGGYIPRFTFNGLTPDTTYYVMIKNETDGKQMGSPLKVKTEPSAADASKVVTEAGKAKAGDLILFQNFAGLTAFCDDTSNSAGYYLGGHASATSQPAIQGVVTCGSNYLSRKVNANGCNSSGAGLFSSWDPSIESCGLLGWGWYGDASGNARADYIGIRSGYVKAGVVDGTPTLYTPQLSALPGKATVRVTFRSAPYGTPKGPISTVDHREIKVFAIDGTTIQGFTSEDATNNYKVTGGTVIGSPVVIKFDDDQAHTDWKEYTVDLVDVSPTSRIAIGGNSTQKTNRFYLDDIRVEVLSISNGIWTGLVRATDTTLNLGWTITESNKKNNYFLSLFPNDPTKNALDHNGYDKDNYTVYLYRDKACTDLEFQADYGGSFFREGSEGAYSYFPCRIIFSGLTPSTTYYFRVKDKVTGKITDAVPYTTLAKEFNGSPVTSGAAVGDVLVYENFGKLYYTGDFANYAAGYTRSALSSAKVNCKAEGKVSWSEQTIDGESVDFGRCDANTESALFSTCNGLIDDMGLDEWGYISTDSLSRVFIKPGYVKIGGSEQLAGIVTPKLTGLSTSSLSQVQVSFKACKLSTQNYNNSVNEDYVVVRGITGASIMPLTDATMPGYVYGGYDSDAVSLSLDSALGEWKEYTVTLDGVSGDTRVAICGNRPTAGNSRFFLDDIKVTVKKIGITVITGKVSPAVAGVAVTDGYTTVLTDSSGNYKIPYTKKPEYIYYSTPHNREIGRAGTGVPVQYLAYKSGTNTGYNFTLGAKMTSSTHINFNASADKLDKWFLFVMADPQTHEDSVDNCYKRFSEVAVPDLRAQVDRGYNSACNSSSGANQAYGVLLGDVVWDSTDDNYHGTMKAKLEVGDTGVYWFACPGNHDYNKTSRTITGFKSIYGPTRHSFNRGDVHVVCMNNVQYTSTSSYEAGFSDDEFNWLRSDLAAVPKDKCVVLCCHVQFYSGGAGTHLKARYHDETLAELSKFANAYIFTGHRHNHKSYYHKNYNIFEVNHPAACGQFWNTKCCSDGSPAGYTIYTFKGNNIEHQRYKAFGTNGSGDLNVTSRNSTENGLRVYWAADQIYNTANQIDRYTWGHTNTNVIVANVFLAHQLGGPSGTIAGNWKVQISDDSGKTWKNMDLVDATFFRHSVPNGLNGFTSGTNGEDFNYKVYIVDKNGNNMNSANYSGTADGVRGDVDWWYWGKCLEKNNNSIINRNGNEMGNAWNYSNTSSHIFRASVSTSYSSRDAVDTDIKNGKLIIKATSPTGITYTANCLTYFDVSNDSNLQW